MGPNYLSVGCHILFLITVSPLPIPCSLIISILRSGSPILIPYTLQSCSPVSAPANTLPCVHASMFSGRIHLCTRLFHDRHRMLLLPLRVPSFNSCSDHRILVVTPCSPLSSRLSVWFPHLLTY